MKTFSKRLGFVLVRLQQRWRSHLIQMSGLCFIFCLILMGGPKVTWAQTPLPADTPLQLVVSDPKDQQKDVLIDSLIQMQFSQLVNPDIQELQFAIAPNAEIGFDIKGELILLKPTEPLKYSTDYTVSLASQSTLPLAKPVQFKFRTEPQYTYNKDVKPLLEASCVGCHQLGGRQKSQLLDTYAAVMNYVKPGEASSELINPRWTKQHATILNANNPNRPQGRGGSPEIAYIQQKGIPLSRLGKFTAKEIELIRTWIVQDKAAEDKQPLPPAQLP